MKFFNILKRLCCLALACGLIIAASGCSEATGADHAFSFSLTSNPKNLDPQMASDNNSLLVIKNMFEGLMRIGPDGELINGVAESYTENDSSTEFVFYLRKDAKWNNGDSVTAYDFEFAWKRALDPATGSSMCNSMYCILNAEAVNNGSMDVDSLGVTVIDAYTLKVSLEYPYAEFPLQTTLAIYMPCNETFFESTFGHYGLDDIYCISNGPFCFPQNCEFLAKEDQANGWNYDNYVRLIRNQNYRGENAVAPRLLYLGVRSSKTDYFDLLNQEVVEAAKIESSNVKKLSEGDFLTYRYTDCTWGMLYNQGKSGFDSPYVRQAFSLCIETALYESLLADNTEVAFDIIPPATKLNGQVYRELAGSGMKLEANPGAAYALLKKGLAEQGLESMPKITVICPNTTECVQIMQNIIQSWQDNLLIYVNLEPVATGTLNNRVSIDDYQIALWCLDPSNDGPINCLKMFGSNYYYNPANLKSGAFDYYLSLASAKTNTQDILAPIVAAEKYLNDSGTFFPMYYETTYYATWNNVEGIYFSPFDGTADFTCAQCYS